MAPRRIAPIHRTAPQMFGPCASWCELAVNPWGSVAYERQTKTERVPK